MPFLFLKLSPIWLCFILSFLGVARLGERGWFRRDWALNWMLATLVLGAVFLLIGEVSSAFEGFGAALIFPAWIIVDVALAIALRASIFRRGSLRNLAPGPVRRWRSLDPASRLLLTASLMLALALGVFVVKTPPTAWDCQTYHLPRIMHWLQQGSLRHYPTNIQRQLESSPGAEIEMAQLYALAGNDLPVSLPEWWAWLTCGVASAWLCRELARGSRAKRPAADERAPDFGPAFALLMALTLPEAITEAITPQNNLLAAMWAMTAVAMGMAFLRDPGKQAYGIAAAAALALGASVKPTFFLYAWPFAAFGLICFAVKRRWRAVAICAASALVLTATLDGPWMARNARLFGDPIGSKGMYAIETIAHNNPKKTAANVLRNLSLYTRTPSDTVTTLVNFAIDWTVRAMGESMDDPNAIFRGSGLLATKKAAIAQGEGWGNCYTLLLIAAAAVVCAFQFRANPILSIYLALVAVGFVAFCGYLRYQPWHPRLHVGFWLLATPPVAAALCSRVDRWVAALLGGFLLANALLILLCHPMLPVWAALKGSPPREDLYFAARPDWREPTVKVADAVLRSGATNVLLKVSEDSWEYPLWITLKNRGFRGAIEHVAVENASVNLSQSPYQPIGSLLIFDVNPGKVGRDFPVRESYGPWTVCLPR